MTALSDADDDLDVKILRLSQFDDWMDNQQDGTGEMVVSPSSPPTRSPSPIPDPDLELMEIERDMDDESMVAQKELCQICLWRDATAIFDHCRHRAYCGLCVKKVKLLNKRAREPPACPLCRQVGAIIAGRESYD